MPQTDRIAPSLYRISYFWIAVVIVLFVFVCNASSADIEIQQLVEQLSSSKRSERIWAEEKLLNAKLNVLPELTTLAEQKREHRFQLLKLIEKIRKRAAEETLLGQTVLLDQERFTAEERVKQVRQQTGIDLRLPSNLLKQPTTMEAGQYPFWQVVDELSKELNCNWQWDQASIYFVSSQSEEDVSREYVDCLRVQVLQSEKRQNLRSKFRRGLMRLNFQFDLEPTVRPFLLNLAANDFQLTSTTDEGDWIGKPFSPGSKLELPAGESPRFKASLDFIARDLPEDTDLSVKGKIELMCSARPREIRASLLNKESIQPELKIVETSEKANKIVVTVDIQLPEELAEFDSHRLSLLHQDAWLDSSDGTRSKPEQVQILSHTGSRHRVEFSFLSDHAKNTEAFVYLYPDQVVFFPVSFKMMLK